MRDYLIYLGQTQNHDEVQVPVCMYTADNDVKGFSAL